MLNSAAHVLSRPDKFPKAVVITILSVGHGSHDPIMVPATSRSTVRDGIARAGQVHCRQLARKSPECRDRQLRVESFLIEILAESAAIGNAIQVLLPLASAQVTASETGCVLKEFVHTEIPRI